MKSCPQLLSVIETQLIPHLDQDIAHLNTSNEALAAQISSLKLQDLQFDQIRNQEVNKLLAELKCEQEHYL